MNQLAIDFTAPPPDRFDGSDYDHARDSGRLSAQMSRVWACIKDGQPRTLRQIADMTRDPEASVSAQLRHLRKPRFGGHHIGKEHLGAGLYVYRLMPQGKAGTQ